MSRAYLNTEIESMFDNEITDDALLSDKLLCNNDTLSFTSNELLWDLNDDDLDTNQYYDPIADKNKDPIDFDYLNEFSYLMEAGPEKVPVKQEPTQSDSVSSACLTDDCSPSSSSTNSPVGRKVRKRDLQSRDDSTTDDLLHDEFPGSIQSPHRYKSIQIDNNQSIIKRESIVQSQPSSRTVYKLSTGPSDRRDHPIIIANNLAANNNYGLYGHNNNNNNQSNHHHHRSIVKINRPSSSHTTGQAGVVPLIVSGTVKTVSISKYPPPTQNPSNVSMRYSSPATTINDSADLMTGDYYDGELELFAVNDNNNNNNNAVSTGNGCSNSNSSSCNNSNGGDFTFSSGKPSRSYSSSVHHNSGVFNNGALFQTPIPQSGTLYLTEEERKTLIQENYPIPTRVPLTKQEERNLKKVRRKIKNKLSAQESRRKKKEYVDALEKKVEAYEQERIENKRRIETLENQQRTLQNQIRHYQHQMMNKITGTGNTTSTGLMLFMICFALILVGGSVPSSYRKMNPPQSSLISSASLYYMGYGPSRSIINNSQNSIYHDNARAKPPNHLIDQRMPSNIDTIIPRQSILLGEDSDDRNFEELVLSYRKPRNKMCDSNYIIDSVRHSFSGTKNNDTLNPRKTILEDLVITRVSNINILK